MQLSENMSQDLAQWYRLQQALHPNLDAPELWATDLTPQKRAVRDQLIQQWAQEKRDALWSEISGDIKDPSLVDVSRIDLDAGDVRGSYNPRGVSGIGSGGEAATLAPLPA
jgi:conjugal transfer mating pair stabilization protein TraG